MKHLPEPIDRALTYELDEAHMQRLWRGTEGRLYAFEGANARHALLRWLFGGGAIVAAAAVAFLIVMRSESPREALALADGSQPSSIVRSSKDAAPAHLRFADGSSIELETGSDLEVVANTAETFATHIEQGRAHFSVAPGGLRRWVVQLPLATIEVLGTRFSVDSQPERLRIEVRRGRVRVWGPFVPNGETTLEGGDELVVQRPSEAKTELPTIADEPLGSTTQSEAGQEGSQDATDTMDESAAAADEEVVAYRATAWKALARRGEHRSAYAMLGADGLRARVGRASVDELMLLADVARLSGHPAGAVAPLRRVIDRHPRDSRAALAALTLGRIEMDSLGHPARAKAALNKALQLGLPRSLQWDAKSRLKALEAADGQPR